MAQTDQSGLLESGNVDLYNRPKVHNPKTGGTSTVFSKSWNIDGKETLLPTVSDDGRMMSDSEAISTYRKTGKHLGKFNSPASANAYAKKLHEDFAAGKYEKKMDSVDTFLGMDKESQTALLGKLSPEAKEHLRTGLNDRRRKAGKVAPDVRPPNVDMKQTALPGLTSAAVKAGDVVKSAGSVVKSAAQQDAGAMDELERNVAPVVKNLPNYKLGDFRRGAIETVKAAGREVAGKPQPGKSVLTAPEGALDRTAGALTYLVGGDPAKARENKAKGEYGREVSDLVGLPLLSHGLGEVIKSLPGMHATEEVPTTKGQLAQMKKVMGREYINAPPVEAAERARALQSLGKQSFQELGIDDQNVSDLMATRAIGESQTDYVGRITRGNDLALQASKKAVEIADRPLRAVMKTFAKDDAGGINLSIARELDRMAATGADEGVNNALRKLANQVRVSDTYGDLDTIKVHANKEIEGLMSAIPGQGINASAQSAYAYRLAADEIRKQMYPALQGKSKLNVSLTEVGKREADAIAWRDGIHATYYQTVLGEEADKRAMSYLEYVFGAGHDHSLYSRHVARRMMEGAGLLPGPGGMFNRSVRQGIGRQGAGFTPETVSVRYGAGQKALPPLEGGAEGQFFTIPTGLPEEITTPGNITTRSRYEGQRTVDNPDFQPLDRRGTGYVSKTPAGERRAALGTTGDATPDESFTGPRTRSESVWQRFQEGEGPTVRTEGGGNLHTNDAELAQATLDRLRAHQERLAGVGSASEQARIQTAINNLQTQLNNWNAYRGASRPRPPRTVTVHPGKRGQVTTQKTLRRNRLLKTLPPLTGGLSRLDQDQVRDRREQ